MGNPLQHAQRQAAGGGGGRRRQQGAAAAENAALRGGIRQKEAKLNEKCAGTLIPLF